jgi:DNA-binding transcriptional regulator YiaG
MKNDLFANSITFYQEFLDFDDLDMARLLKVSIPTIRRWKVGKTEPHDLAKEPIFRVLENKSHDKHVGYR